MSKYSFFVYAPEYHDFLVYLRSLGVVHIKERNSTKEVQSFQQNRAEQEVATQLKNRTEIIQKSVKIEEGHKAIDIPHIDLPTTLFDDYTTYKLTFREIEEHTITVQQEIQGLKAIIEQLQPWGDFSSALIERLAERGYYFHFFTVDQSLYNEVWENDYQAFPIAQKGRSRYFVSITQYAEPPRLEGAEIQDLPKGESISSLLVKKEQMEEKLALLQSTLLYLSLHTEVIDRYLVRLKDEFNFDNATYQGDKLFDNRLIFLEGWVPTDKVDSLENDLKATGSAFIHSKVQQGEEAPIQLKNNRFVRVFEPIVRMFSLPNYTELDPTPYIAPFFMVFFGICFGDAGYGLLVLLLTTIFKCRSDKKDTKELLELVQWLGFAGMTIGFISGSFFGLELPKVPLFANVKEYFLTTDNMMVISLVLGFIQVLVAKYVGAMKKTKQQGWKYALSAYAWPTLIIFLALILGLPALNIQLPESVNYILYGVIGFLVLVILFFNSPGKSIFLNIGSALWATYNTTSGLLGDVLSYIRLFAIGLTGAILGQVFNSLAMTASSGLHPILAFVVGAIILVLGHGINFGLATIGALVHPIRLIFVEYFNNSDYEGGGNEYTPLQKLSQEEK